MGIAIIFPWVTKLVNKDYKISDDELFPEKPPKPIKYPPLEMFSFYVDDVKDIALLERYLVDTMGKIKKGKERLIATIYIAPVLKAHPKRNNRNS